MCMLHWILHVLCVEFGKLIVFDSLRKKQREIQCIHRPIEQVSLICTIKHFSFLDQLNIEYIFKLGMWKKIVKKTKVAVNGRRK